MCLQRAKKGYEEIEEKMKRVQDYIQPPKPRAAQEKDGEMDLKLKQCVDEMEKAMQTRFDQILGLVQRTTEKSTHNLSTLSFPHSPK